MMIISQPAKAIHPVQLLFLAIRAPPLFSPYLRVAELILSLDVPTFQFGQRVAR
jgi:hypothetical protein